MAAVEQCRVRDRAEPVRRQRLWSPRSWRSRHGSFAGAIGERIGSDELVRRVRQHQEVRRSRSVAKRDLVVSRGRNCSRPIHE